MFWCDEKLILGYRYKNKKLYSLSIMEENDDVNEEGTREDNSFFS